MRVPTQLRDLVAGAAVIEVSVGGASDRSTTVAAVLDALAVQHPVLERRIRDEQGRTRRHVNLFVETDNVRDRDGPATPMASGEQLSIIPAVSGGALTRGRIQLGEPEVLGRQLGTLLGTELGHLNLHSSPRSVRAEPHA